MYVPAKKQEKLQSFLFDKTFDKIILILLI